MHNDPHRRGVNTQPKCHCGDNDDAPPRSEGLFDSPSIFSARVVGKKHSPRVVKLWHGRVAGVEAPRQVVCVPAEAHVNDPIPAEAGSINTKVQSPTNAIVLLVLHYPGRAAIRSGQQERRPVLDAET